MVFRCKKKKKVMKARPANKVKTKPVPPWMIGKAKAAKKASFASVRASSALLKEAEKSPEGPSAVDLIHLHYQDKGYKTRVLPGSDFDGVKVDFTHLMPSVRELPSAATRRPAVLCFYVKDGVVFVSDGPSPATSMLGKAYVGLISDPKIMGIIDSYIGFYLLGASRAMFWVKDALH